MSLLLMCALASAQDNWVGVSLLLPQNAERIVMTAQVDLSQPSVLVDDGSIQWDRPNDGEWFGLVRPTQRISTLTIQGTIDSVPVFHQESVGTPMLQDTTYVVTFRVRPEDGGWAMERIVTPAQLGPQRRTGSGLAARAAEDVGISATSLYLAWGAVLLVLLGAALVRSALARAHSELGSR
ncbi:MAG TPA: hypothetical protein QGF58_28995 [Myxococcota bacterium]|nr:hypothetical protein [Myxococcota bacterium]